MRVGHGVGVKLERCTDCMIAMSSGWDIDYAHRAEVIAQYITDWYDNAVPDEVTTHEKECELARKAADKQHAAKGVWK